MKVTDKCTFPDGLLWGNKKITRKNVGQYRYCDHAEYLIIWHLSSPIGARI